MKFHQLPAKHKVTALGWAVDAINELYRSEGLPLVNEDAPEVLELAMERDYEIVCGKYHDGVKYERLEY